MNDSILNSPIYCANCETDDVTQTSCHACDDKQCTICDSRKPCIICDNLFCFKCIIENPFNGIRYCHKCLDKIDTHAGHYKLLLEQLAEISKNTVERDLRVMDTLSFRYGLLEGEIKGLLNRFSL